MELFYFISGVIATLGFAAVLNVIFMRIARKSIFESKRNFEDKLLEHYERMEQSWEQISDTLFYLTDKPTVEDK